jgi:hypothetical protein
LSKLPETCARTRHHRRSVTFAPEAYSLHIGADTNRIIDQQDVLPDPSTIEIELTEYSVKVLR